MAKFVVTTHRGEDAAPRTINVILADDPETERIRMRHLSKVRIGDDMERKEVEGGFEFVNTEDPNVKVTWIRVEDATERQSS